MDCRFVLRAAVLAVSMTTVSCGMLHHEYQFTQNPQPGQAKGHKLEGTKVFVDLTRTPDSFEQSTNGHSFHVFGIHQNVKATITGVLVGVQWVADEKEADAVIAVDSNIELSSTFTGTSATARVTCRILDKSGKVLTEKSTSQTSEFPVMSNGGRNCEIAELNALAGALGEAVGSL
jgi:hypothetical protein